MAESNRSEAIRYPFGIIEVEKRDSSTPTGGNAFDTTAIETKVATPSLLPWVEKEDDFV